MLMFLFSPYSRGKKRRLPYEGIVFPAIEYPSYKDFLKILTSCYCHVKNMGNFLHDNAVLR